MQLKYGVLVLSLIISATTGCVGLADDPPGDSVGLSQITLHRADLPAHGGAIRVVAEVVRSGTLSVKAATETPRGEIMEDCGRLAVQAGGTAIGWVWSASAGHAVVVAHEGKPRMYNVSGTKESIANYVDLNDHFEVDLAVGDRIAFSMAAGSRDPVHVSAIVAIDGSTAGFKIISKGAESYACGANVFDFEGTRLSTAAWPASAGIAQASRNVGRTLNSTWGTFKLFSFGATSYQALICELELRIDGQLFNKTGLRSDQCLIDLSYAPAGEIQLIIRAEISAGGVLARWEIWDRPIPSEIESTLGPKPADSLEALEHLHATDAAMPLA